MSDIKNSFIDLIGNTPIVKLNKTQEKYKLEANILAKLEYFNPAGSSKDRVGKEMIIQAINRGEINSNTTIIEPTSGNTGIGLAAVCTSLNLKLIIVMPENMSEERKKLMKVYGAKLILTDASKGMSGAIDKANELHKEIDNSIIAGQFDNPDNPLAHYKTTGPEIWNQTDGKIDIFVAGIGTGGTISGVGKYLKEMNYNIKVIGVEPATSPVITKGISGSHQIQGIGAGFIPKALDTNIYDEVLAINNEDAFLYSKELVKNEGIFVGISSGAALKGAIDIASLKENKDKNIVVLLPDGGDRYLSTPLVD